MEPKICKSGRTERGFNYSMDNPTEGIAEQQTWMMCRKVTLAPVECTQGLESIIADLTLTHKS